MSEHTPGPWVVACIAWGGYSGPDKIGVTAPTINGEGGMRVDVGSMGDSTAEANARLIAAAPELLAFLRDEILPWMIEENEWEASVIKRAEELVAKAGGQVMSEKVLVCPYCGSEKTGEEMGCCGESRDHFEYVDASEHFGEEE